MYLLSWGTLSRECVPYPLFSATFQSAICLKIEQMWLTLQLLRLKQWLSSREVCRTSPGILLALCTWEVAGCTTLMELPPLNQLETTFLVSVKQEWYRKVWVRHWILQIEVVCLKIIINIIRSYNFTAWSQFGYAILLLNQNENRIVIHIEIY